MKEHLHTMQDGSQEYNNDEFVGLIMNIINEIDCCLWGNSEHSLGFFKSRRIF